MVQAAEPMTVQGDENHEGQAFWKVAWPFCFQLRELVLGLVETKVLFDAVEMGFDQVEGAGVVSEALPGCSGIGFVRNERRVIPRAG